MKKQLLLPILGLFLMLASCNKNDDDNKNNNQFNNAFEYANQTYPLKDGTLEYWWFDDEENSHQWDVQLFTSNFELDFDGFIPFIFEDDVISLIYLELNNNSGQDLTVGTYQIDEDNFAPFKCSYAELIFLCDVSNLDEATDEDDICQDFIEIVAGTITIKEVGNTYEIEIDGLTEYGTPIKAHYKGGLKDFDEPRMASQVQKLRLNNRQK